MMYPYMILADETEIVHSQIIEKDGMKKVIVNFERPTENGFDSARCELPDYKWTDRQGYSDEEIAMFEELLHIRFIFGLMKMANRFMFMYQRESLRLMQQKSGLQSQVGAFWQVMAVKYLIKN